MAANILVSGKWVESAHKIAIHAPFDQRVIGETFEADADLLERAISAVADAVPTMQALSPRERADFWCMTSLGAAIRS